MALSIGDLFSSSENESKKQLLEASLIEDMTLVLEMENRDDLFLENFSSIWDIKPHQYNNR